MTEPEKDVKNFDDEIVQYVSELHKTGESELASYKSRLNDFYKQYHSIPGKKYSKYAKANIFVPETFRAIEALTSDIYQLLFSEDPFFILQNRQSIDELNQVKITTLTNTQLEDICFKRRMISAIRYILIYGTIIIRYFWDSKTTKQIISKVDKISGNYDRADIEQNVIIKDTPEFEVVNLLDMTIDPSVSNVQDAEWIILRKRLSLAELKRWAKAEYIENVTEIENITNKDRKDSIDDLKNARLEALGFAPSEKRKKSFVILEYWGKGLKQHIYPELVDTDEGKEEIEVHYIVCEKVVLRKKENVYNDKKKPFVSCSLFEDGTIFSENICSISESSQQELNTTHSQMLDHRTFTLFHMWLKGQKSGAKRGDFKIELNKVIDCEDVNQIKEIVPNPGAMTTAIQAENTTRDDIRNATAATSIQQGIRSAGTLTATEASSLLSQGSARVRMMAISIAEQLLKPLLQAFYQLNKQYLDDPVFLSIEKPLKKNITIEPSELNSEYTFTPKVMTDAVNQITIRENLLRMLETSSKLAGVVPPESIYKLMRKIYEFFKFKDTDEIFPLPVAPAPANVPPGNIPPEEIVSPTIEGEELTP